MKSTCYCRRMPYKWELYDHAFPQVSQAEIKEPLQLEFVSLLLPWSDVASTIKVKTQISQAHSVQEDCSTCRRRGEQKEVGHRPLTFFFDRFLVTVLSLNFAHLLATFLLVFGYLLADPLLPSPVLRHGDGLGFLTLCFIISFNDSQSNTPKSSMRLQTQE